MFFRGRFFIFFYGSAFSLISHADSNITADVYDKFKLMCHIGCENSYMECSDNTKINETIHVF